MTDSMGDLWGGLGGEQPEAKAPPADEETEASFLATLSFMPEAKAVETALLLEENDFFFLKHKLIYRAIRVLQQEEAEINSLTIRIELDKEGQLHRVGDYQGITEVLQAEEVERPEVLALQIKEKSRLRQLIAMGSRIVSAAEGGEDSQSILSGASEGLTRLATGSPLKDLVTDMTDLVEELASGASITTENGGHAMSWGDDHLDMICPIPRGEPTLIVARPGVGKSALGCIQVPVATLTKGYGKPLVLSLEMGKQKVKARLAAHLTGTNSRDFRDGNYAESDIRKVNESMDVLKGIKWMFPRQECPVEEIESLVRYAIDVFGIDCVVLDQFSHLLPPKAAKSEPFAFANAALSRRITALAKNLNLGWVTLGQLNKDGDDQRRPNMKDLADTDRLAKDAAVILGLWTTGTTESQEVWATIIKNRDDGFKGWAKQLKADYGTCRFEVPSQETKVVFKPKKNLFGLDG